MEIINRSPFPFAYLSSRYHFPGHSMTLIVKGTFELRHGEAAAIAAEQLFPTGDERYPEDDEGTGSLRYENDFAPWKPRADLLLVGSCHPPGGTAVPATFVRFCVGDHGRTVAVSGRRSWKGLLARMTAAEPFTRMSIRYENSFGGANFSRNPTGKGHGATELPNLEDPDHPVRGPRDHPDPAGFGPLGRMWKDRFSKVGTYKGRWKQERFPGFPEDFDWGHFNAAPEGLQVEGYLRGDEALTMENLHPEIARYSCKLPGLRVRCFLQEAVGRDAGEPLFREVEMNLDTLWVDMDSERLVLVWRGVSPVQSDEFDDIESVFVRAESVHEVPLSLDACKQSFPPVQVDLDRAPEEAREEAPPPPDAETDADEEEWAPIRAALAALPEQVPPPEYTPTPAQLQAGREYLAKQGILLQEDEAEQPVDEPQARPSGPWNRADVERRIQQGDPLGGLDLRGLDLAGLHAREVDFTGADLRGACLAGADLSGAILERSNLESADLSGCQLKAAVISNAHLKFACLTAALLDDADFTRSVLTQADLSSARAAGAIFEEAQLDGSRLERILAPGAQLVEANLEAAHADAAVFDAATFAGANLRGASFRRASLKDSNWAGVQGQRVILDHAELQGFRARDGCDLSHASLRQATGKEPVFQSAILPAACFAFARLEGANFKYADLRGADFESAQLPSACFARANLQGARLVTMNLLFGSLEKADLEGADLSGSNLYGVEFFEATISHTLVRGANLRMANHFKAG